MTQSAVTSPFSDEALDEVPLASAPLARVIAQVRFPRLSALAASTEVANEFASAMRAEYPIFDEQREHPFTLSPAGVSQGPGAVTWKLRDADGDWQVSFGDSFMAIDTGRYSSRTDLISRFVSAWSTFVELVSPPYTERLGIRYINRIVDQAVINDLPKLVRPEVLGSVAVPLAGAELNHSITETLYRLSDTDQLQTRWGLLPPGVVLDATVTPVPNASWILDLDSYFTGSRKPNPESIRSHLQGLADRGYRYFRWAVTPEFLERFGKEGL